MIKSSVGTMALYSKLSSQNTTTRKAAEQKPAPQEKPLSQKEKKRLAAKIPTSRLTVEHYADRPNPELSWAAAILKRGKSSDRQRAKAAAIMSRYGAKKSAPKIAAYWKALSPPEKHEIAARGGRRRWEIWREQRAATHGKETKQ